MDKSYWKKYWDKHLKHSSNDPFMQVLRVKDKKPVDIKVFKEFTKHIINTLEVNKKHKCLDLCCGNGLITIEIAYRCKEVVAVDFCDKLIDVVNNYNFENITSIVSDILDLPHSIGNFDRILMAAALQHFSQSQIIQLFKKQYDSLNENGRFLVTDILDQNKLWQFYNSSEREIAYFDHLKNNTPILGTWIDQLWLQKLSKYCGFRHSKVITQSPCFPYSNYRFDLLCIK